MAERAVARAAVEREAARTARGYAERSTREAEKWRAAALASLAAAEGDARSLHVLRSALDSAPPQYGTISELSSAHSDLQEGTARAEAAAAAAEARASLVEAEAAAERASFEREIEELRRELESRRGELAKVRNSLSGEREKEAARKEKKERGATRAKALREGIAMLVERAAAVVPPSSLSFAAVKRAADAGGVESSSPSSSSSSLAEGILAVGIWCGDVSAAAAGK